MPRSLLKCTSNASYLTSVSFMPRGTATVIRLSRAPSLMGTRCGVLLFTITRYSKKHTNAAVRPHKRNLTVSPHRCQSRSNSLFIVVWMSEIAQKTRQNLKWGIVSFPILFCPNDQQVENQGGEDNNCHRGAGPERLPNHLTARNGIAQYH